MIHRIAAAITSWLITMGVVESNDRELFEYAAYCLIFGSLPIIIVVVWGIVFRLYLESLVLIIPFMLIRKFSGGYHLASAKVCFVTSVAILGVSLLMTKLIYAYGRSEMLSGAVLLSVLCICKFSPIDSDARKLTPKETILFQKIARIISVVMMVVYFTGRWTGRIHFSVPFGIGIVIPALLQLPAIGIRLFQKNKSASQIGQT